MLVLIMMMILHPAQSGNFYGTPLPPRQDEVNLSDPPSPQRSSPRSDLHLGRNGEAESGMTK